MAAALAAALVLGSACRPTEWPSDADKAAFCDEMSHGYDHGRDGELARIGTPVGLPYQARRYLLHRQEGRDPVAGDQELLQSYVADHC